MSGPGDSAPAAIAVSKAPISKWSLLLLRLRGDLIFRLNWRAFDLAQRESEGKRRRMADCSDIDWKSGLSIVSIDVAAKSGELSSGVLTNSMFVIAATANKLLLLDHFGDYGNLLNVTIQDRLKLEINSTPLRIYDSYLSLS